MMSMATTRLAFDHAFESAVRSSIAAAMVIAEPVLYEIVYNFRLWPTFAGKCQQRVITIRSRRGRRGRKWGRSLASDLGMWRRAGMELAYFSGYFRLKQRETGGAGVILRFERVRPRDSRPFQPNRWREITPQFLDRTIRALKRWNFDLITMDEVCRRAVTLPKANRFACLTFDGGCKDVITQAYPELAKLAADPLVTIGSATVNYPALSNLKEADAQREMTMGKAVAETALHRVVRHFAYPFGDRQSWRREHVVMGQEAGFASAVSTIPGVVEARGYTNLHALPRIAWDGRQRSLRMMRVMLSGMMFPAVRPTRDNWV